MITFSLFIMIFGIIFHRNNFLVLSMILELIYLLLAYLFISLEMDFFVLVFLGVTGCETAVGLSILLGYYLRTSVR
jgi:NADH:ubiquinone oxidoreductase subunit K